MCCSRQQFQNNKHQYEELHAHSDVYTKTVIRFITSVSFLFSIYRFPVVLPNVMRKCQNIAQIERTYLITANRNRSNKHTYTTQTRTHICLFVFILYDVFVFCSCVDVRGCIFLMRDMIFLV